MKIVVAPDPILRQKCEPVTPQELPKLAKKAQQMAKLMYKSEGCGLAAPQVGLTKRLIVVDTNPREGKDFTPDPTFLVNPVITVLDGDKDVCSEGCLSLPGITVDIERCQHVEIDALDLDGDEIHIEAEGFAARALQHELDHLEGITMFEHLDSISRIEKLKEFEIAKAAGAKPGDISIDKSAAAKHSADKTNTAAAIDSVVN